jgi:hypothetical protein
MQVLTLLNSSLFCKYFKIVTDEWNTNDQQPAPLIFFENPGIDAKKIPCSIITHNMDVLHWSSTISCFHSDSRT